MTPKHSSTERILGIDPGLNITGYGAIDCRDGQAILVEAGVVRGRSRGQLEPRLLEIYDGITDVIASLSPTKVALEQLYSHYKRPQTAILMGHARGVICLAVQKAGKPLVHYSATQVKKILTGSGRAPKLQVQQAIQRELRLAETPDPPDVADALAIAMCHFYLSRHER